LGELKSKKRYFSLENLDFLKYVPAFILEIFFTLFVFLNYDLGLKFSFLGLPRECFGHHIIYDARTSSYNRIFLPLSKITRTISTNTLTSPRKKALVEDGKIVVKMVCDLNTVIDHRFGDGSDFGKMIK